MILKTFVNTAKLNNRIIIEPVIPVAIVIESGDSIPFPDFPENNRGNTPNIVVNEAINIDSIFDLIPRKTEKVLRDFSFILSRTRMLLFTEIPAVRMSPIITGNDRGIFNIFKKKTGRINEKGI